MRALRGESFSEPGLGRCWSRGCTLDGADQRLPPRSIGPRCRRAWLRRHYSHCPRNSIAAPWRPSRRAAPKLFNSQPLRSCCPGPRNFRLAIDDGCGAERAGAEPGGTGEPVAGHPRRPRIYSRRRSIGCSSRAGDWRPQACVAAWRMSQGEPRGGV